MVKALAALAKTRVLFPTIAQQLTPVCNSRGSDALFWSPRVQGMTVVHKGGYMQTKDTRVQNKTFNSFLKISHMKKKG